MPSRTGTATLDTGGSLRWNRQISVVYRSNAA
jgi:hypothetical protein